ncbi:hypothetical protein [Bosea sp. TAF32]|uniref:hypothetical protein n=1 Tax=Bosea sp. TAF32 TaxID=3237482 RepID=UPI003F8F9E97
MSYSLRPVGSARNEPAKRDFDPDRGAKPTNLALPGCLREGAKAKTSASKAGTMQIDAILPVELIAISELAGIVPRNVPSAAGHHVSRSLRQLRFPAGARRIFLLGGAIGTGVNRLLAPPNRRFGCWLRCPGPPSYAPVSAI